MASVIELSDIMSKLEEIAHASKVASIPVAERYLESADIAALLSLKPAYVREKICTRADFPSPVRVDGKGHPRWKGSEVLTWAESHRMP